MTKYWRQGAVGIGTLGLLAALSLALLGAPSFRAASPDLPSFETPAILTSLLQSFARPAVAGPAPAADIPGRAMFQGSTATWYVVSASGDPSTFTFGEPGSMPLVGDWDGDGIDTVGAFSPVTGVFIARNTNSSGRPEITVHRPSPDATPTVATRDGADTITWSTHATTTARDTGWPAELGSGLPLDTANWSALPGHFGHLESGISLTIAHAPIGLAYAVEALYLEHQIGITAAGTSGSPVAASLIGTASTVDTGTTQLAVVEVGQDTILASSTDRWHWSIIGGTLPSQGVAALNPNPTFVAMIGTDSLNGWGLPGSWTRQRASRTFADSIHIYTFDPTSNEGAIVGIPRDTAMAFGGLGSVGGMQKINRVNEYTTSNGGPWVTKNVLANETGLPLDGYIQIGFGADGAGGHDGFIDLIDVDTAQLDPGMDFLVPYSVISVCKGSTPIATVGDTSVTGAGALALSRERTCVPTNADGTPIRNGNVVRTLSQGLLLKSAVSIVQDLGVGVLPQLIATLIGNEADPEDGYITTDLTAAQLLTVGQTLFEVDPGPMPTLTPSDIATYGDAAYDLNPGTLPNVVVEGCTGLLAADDYAQFFVDENRQTFTDLKDGKLDALPVYQYYSGDPDFPLACPDLLGSVTRIAGANRYETAALISKAKFAPGVPVAYVATGLLFPDALAGGPAASLGHGPILLAQKTALTAPTVNELKRLKPKKIVILGGEAVISASLKTQLQSLTAGTVTRLSGADRFGTAAAISKASFNPGVDVAYVATGYAFPDALAGGPVAAMDKGPILLVNTDNLPGPTIAELNRLKPKRIVILGGPSAVGTGVQAALDAYTTGLVTRLSGANRYETAKAISASKFAPGVTVVYVATGLNFPDALAAGPLAGLDQSPILLVETNSIPNPAAAELNRLKPKRIVIVGGTGVISTSVANQLAGYTNP